MFMYYPVFPVRFLFQFVFHTFVLNPKYHCRRCRQDREALKEKRIPHTHHDGYYVKSAENSKCW